MPRYGIKLSCCDHLSITWNTSFENLGAANEISNMHKVKLRRRSAKPASSTCSVQEPENSSVATSSTLSPSKKAFIVSQYYVGRSLVITKVKSIANSRRPDSVVEQPSKTEFGDDHRGLHYCLSQRGNVRRSWEISISRILIVWWWGWLSTQKPQ